MLASLRMRLLLVGVGVALFTVLVASFAVQRLTEREIRSSITRDVQRERDIQDELGLVAAIEGGWSDIADDVERLSLTYDERIAVVDSAGKVLADSELLRFGRAVPLPRQAFALDPTSRLLMPNPSATVITQIGANFPNIINCISGSGGAIGVSPADSEAATGFHVDGSCLVNGLPTVAIPGEQGGPPGGPISFPELATAATIEPVQLFVGYRDQSPPLFPSAWSLRFWLAVVLPVLAAAAAMFLTARRMLGPIGSLTTAAARMNGGDLAARAETRGRDELAQLGTTFNEMAGSLQAADQARRTLTSDVAHELRSPLANLRGWLEGIQDGVVEPNPEVIGSLHEEATNLQALVDDLQDLSLAEAGHLALDRQPVDLAELLQRAVDAHLPAASLADVRLSTDLPADDAPIVVDGDPRRLRQVVVNLVSNAIRHTPSSGAVTVRLRRTETGAAITVTDTGEGIAAEHLPRVLERFWRADASRTRATGGSGLGLAIVRQLVVAHGGSVTVESTVGSGTTFTIALPIPPLQAHTVLTPTPLARKSHGPSDPNGPSAE